MRTSLALFMKEESSHSKRLLGSVPHAHSHTHIHTYTRLRLSPIIAASLCVRIMFFFVCGCEIIRLSDAIQNI